MFIGRLDLPVPACLPKEFLRALDFLRTLHAMPAAAQHTMLGRHELDGAQLFVNVETYTSRLPAQARWEAHREHADIQLVLQGRERIGIGHDIAALDELEPWQPDVSFYSEPAHAVWVPLQAAAFAVIWPRQPHAPCMAALDAHGLATPEPVLKAVAKIKL